MFRQTCLLIAVSLWAIIIGGIVYSHVVYFPVYLGDLPASAVLVSGSYALHEENFWMLVHPPTLLFTLVSLALSWRDQVKRRYLLAATLIYFAVIAVTAMYFLPGLRDFANSASDPSMTPAQWDSRGKTWQQLSWVRGVFMYLSFVLMIQAYRANESGRQASATGATAKRKAAFKLGTPAEN